MAEINGRKFEFAIPSPFDGCAIYDAIMSYNMPFGAGVLFNLSPKIPMTAEKLKEFQKLCLSNASEILDDNKARVVDEQGEIGINDAAAPLLTTLTVKYIAFFTQWWDDEIS